MGSWIELAVGVYLRSDDDYSVNTGLVVGTRRAAVIDTGSGPRQGGRILTAVREITAMPLIVVNTHAHFDHFFGNAVFAAGGTTEFWAHRAAAAQIFASGDSQRPAAADTEPEMAGRAGSTTEIIVPTRLVDAAPVDVDLGGREIELFRLGRGHTGGDLLAGASGILFAGDLIEEGADPAFEDAFPEEWIGTLESMARLADRYHAYVPGHGSPMNVDFVIAQRETMRAAVRQGVQALREAGTDAAKSMSLLPYGPAQSRALLNRLRELGPG